MCLTACACLQGQHDIANILAVQLPGGRTDISQHVRLNSGYTMPLLGWGSSGAKDSEASQAVRAAIKAGFRVRQALAKTAFTSSKLCFPSAQCVRPLAAACFTGHADFTSREI